MMGGAYVRLGADQRDPDVREIERLLSSYNTPSDILNMLITRHLNRTITWQQKGQKE